MNPIIVGVITFAMAFGGFMIGMRLGNLLPDHHRDSNSKDTIKLGIGLICEKFL